MRQRIHDGFTQNRARVLGQRFAPCSANGFETTGMAADETQAAGNAFNERTGAFLTRGARPGAGADTGATDELHGGTADEVSWFGREQDCRSAQHVWLQGRRCRHGHPQIAQGPVHLTLLHGLTAVSGKDLVYGFEIEDRGQYRGKGLVFAAAMFPLPHEAGHRIATQGL